MPNFLPAQRISRLAENPFSVLERRARARVSSLGLIDLSVGSPLEPTPPEVVARLQQAASDPLNHAYPPFYGKREARLAIAEFYRREYGVALDPDHEIALCHGSHIGITGIPQAIVNEGRYLLSTDPCYPMYRSAAVLAQARFYGIPVYHEHNFLPDYRQVPEAVATQTDLLLLNYPNNPTGALANAPFFARTLAFAREHRIPVLHDFAYASIGDGERRPPSLLAQADAREYVVETYTLSKTFNMAGWRFGFAVGNASIIAAFNKLHTNSYSTQFGAVQEAAMAALALPSERIHALSEVYRRRRERVITRLRAMGWPVRAGQGTFFLWLPVPAGEDSFSFSERLLNEASVLLAPGAGFGAQGAGYVRLSLTRSEEELEEALRRLSALRLFPSV